MEIPTKAVEVAGLYLGVGCLSVVLVSGSLEEEGSSDVVMKPRVLSSDSRDALLSSRISRKERFEVICRSADRRTFLVSDWTDSNCRRLDSCSALYVGMTFRRNWRSLMR